MFAKLLRFIKFRLSAQSLYKIHSPFIYNFINDVVLDKTDYQEYKAYLKLKSYLLSNKETIEITDFGAGSGNNEFINVNRAIKDIARLSSSRKKWALLIFRIVKHFKPQGILELGTSFGLTTSLMSLAHPESNIITMEGCPNIAKQAGRNFETLDLINIRIINSSIDKILTDLVKKEDFYLVYFDGNHRKSATIDYFEKCVPYANESSIFIIDDINWSKGMKEAWEYIKKHPKTVVTLDLYQLGMVFFKSELSPQHFKYSI